MDVPQQVQEDVQQLQLTQQQAQIIATQKYQVDLQLQETKKVLGELDSLGADKQVYKAIGRVLVESNKKDLKKELSADAENLQLRFDSLGKQEERIKKKLQEIQNRVQAAMSTTN